MKTKFILLLLLAVINAILANYNYTNCAYELAMLCSFSFGFCLCALIDALIEL